MKLIRYGPAGEEKPAVLDRQGELRDLSCIIDDLGPDTLGPQTLSRLAALDPLELPRVTAGQRIGPCTGRPGKFVCIGLNYRDHAIETGMALPKEPVVFMKAVSAITGPYDDIELLRGSQKSDWEVELGVVISRQAKYITPKEASEYIAGYCIVNDLSEREWQIERGGNWSKGKSADGYGPIGPWLVTPDEVGDPQALELWLELNGERVQQGSTANMIFPVFEIIAYLSQCMSLDVGDIIATGTPPGVGMGRQPPRFLRDGDRLRLGVAGLGEQCYHVYS
ncbi:MAG TPA: fumarylacetoacetate hydrolase family protein [Arenicellales bacterium]|jgi:2-keto-4-pentenoate hydratase/2-oxohepta-3-ene-1,7-dioic acid hydratase in catechol pathway|nr:fumarylacetoacetate hydrolase family protein [Arenicellales bacterium]HJP06699.1 fumarylacetoacetate hydrolase family protein [Arenicellales bacterium]|tara:strand:- start:583 stop:1422 length:840 start_codon:yes stop_codon:yes gene_type:complete